jgi:hypothetical protein
LIVSAGALASTYNVPYSGKMGGARIEAGRYNITWEHHSPGVMVTVSKGKNVVATVQGKLEERSSRFERNMVVYSTNADGSQTINEIRVGGTNQAIVFE